ncbi:MAG TPA: pyruvate carboxyltransferase, partial [Candidatus Methylomirabilis sp.]
NCPFEDLVLSLLTMYGQDLGIRCEEFYPLSRLIRELSGLQIPSNRPIVGDRVFNIESGIIASWYRNCGKDRPTELFPFHWGLVGQGQAEIVLGKNSGLDSIATWLERIGERASEEEITKILSQVKMKSLEKKGLLTEEEFRQIVRQVKEGQ